MKETCDQAEAPPNVALQEPPDLAISNPVEVRAVVMKTEDSSAANNDTTNFIMKNELNDAPGKYSDLKT